MHRPSEQDFVFLKTIFESGGFVPDAYGKTYAAMLFSRGLIEPHWREKPAVRWIVHERRRSKEGRAFQDKARTYRDVQRGWRLSRDAERAVVTLAALIPGHRTLVYPNWTTRCPKLPPLSHLSSDGWVDIAVDFKDETDMAELTDWCFDHNVTVLSAATLNSRTRFPVAITEGSKSVFTVDEDRGVEFRLRFG